MAYTTKETSAAEEQCTIKGTHWAKQMVKFWNNYAYWAKDAATTWTNALAINCTGTFVPDSSRTNYAFSMGNRATELTVNLAAAASQNLELFQANVNLTCTAEPTSASTVCLMRLRYTHDTTDMTYLRLRALNSYTLITKEIQDAYGCIHGIDFYTNSVTVNGEAVVGVFNMECNSTVTGTVRGMIINVYGNGVPSTTSAGLEVRIDGSSAGTLTEGIRIRAVGGNTITTGLRIYGAAADKIGTGIDVAVTSTASAKNGILVSDTFTLATTGVHKAIQGDVAYTPSTSGYATPIGVAGKVSLNANFTGGTGYMWGVQGQLDLGTSRTINNAASVFAGVRGIISGTTPVFTDADEICCVYADNLCATNMAGMSTGNSSLFRGHNAGGTMDNVLHVWASNNITNLFNFEACENMITAGAATHSGTIKKIACLLDEVTYYLTISTAVS